MMSNSEYAVYKMKEKITGECYTLNLSNAANYSLRGEGICLDAFKTYAVQYDPCSWSMVAIWANEEAFIRQYGKGKDNFTNISAWEILSEQCRLGKSWVRPYLGDGEEFRLKQ